MPVYEVNILSFLNLKQNSQDFIRVLVEGLHWDCLSIVPVGRLELTTTGHVNTEPVKLFTGPYIPLSFLLQGVSPQQVLTRYGSTVQNTDRLEAGLPRMGV